MFLFLPSNNYKHFINEYQFPFVKLKHLNKFQGIWRYTLNKAPLNSEAGGEGRAVRTDLGPWLSDFATQESFRKLGMQTPRPHSTALKSEIPEVAPRQHYFILHN